MNYADIFMKGDTQGIESTNIFDEVEEPIYIDWHHVGPNGNEIIAQAMVRSLTLRSSGLQSD